MKIWIVTEDLGDGDVGLRYFPTEKEANDFCNALMEEAEYGCHESNPHKIDTERMQWTEPYESDDEDEE